LAFANARASREFFLILSLGFFTGMRLGTICDLKIQTILNAVSDPRAPGLYRVALGRVVSPPVATKFGVTGQVHIPEALLAELRDHAYGVERLKRESLADSRNRDLLFLTRVVVRTVLTINLIGRKICHSSQRAVMLTACFPESRTRN
jgi:hypothetical protein